MELVENYLALAKIQLEDRLKCEIQLEEGISDIAVPPMLVQLLVENAIKHGISNRKEGGTILIEGKIIGTQLHLSVINPGNLTPSEDSTHVGLKNIEERLLLLYGNRAQFTLVEQRNQVIANVQIPVHG